ncbi:MAG: helix-hairpin-helix domain-containing protein [Patescibacteria group bacterium]|jgi:competence protein ComEA
MKEDSANPGHLIEKYRFLIGGVLLLAVLSSAAVLLYRENYTKVRSKGDIERLGAEVVKLDKAIAEIREQQQRLIVSASNQSKTQEGQQAANVAQASESITRDAGVVKGQSTQSVSPEKPQVVVSATVNINTASVEQLDALPGIGPTYAKRIVEYREANGKFASIDEVMKVKGIGPKTFEKFKDKITVQ